MGPYLQIPITLPGHQADEEDKQAIGRISPQLIQAYHEGYYWGTFIYMQCGHVFVSPLPIAEFEDQLGKYWNEFNKIAKKSKLHLLQ